MTSRRAASAVVLALTTALAACGTDDAPSIAAIEPRVVVAGETFIVRGAGFTHDYNAFTDTPVGTFVIELDDVEALDVTWIDATRLSARVPDALAPGTYDVTVRGPRGDASRDDAIAVAVP